MLDTHLLIPLESNLVRSAQRDLLIIAGRAAASDRVAKLTAAGAEIAQLPEKEDGVPLDAVLALLGERKLTSVLLEAGSHLNGAFLRADLVDCVVMFRAPTYLGAEAIPFADGIEPDAVEQRLTRVTSSEYGADTCITGYLHDPWARPSPGVKTAR